ncbi:TIGR00282 family metallophosphoesterase [Paenibacillus sp. y28]|uniref:TIGR00282 family metallophosphoesterase n=1 Tax=Paenibacillus sp. y28 TaxID=3129110 RepID=UPI003015E734
MRILFIGDVVGSVGRKALKYCLPILKDKYKPTVIIVNGENAAGGKGITPAIVKEMLAQGVHGITLGNHTWDNKEVFDIIDDEPRLIRPANFPEGTPGLGYTVIKAGSAEVALINLQGRTFLPPLDCPFRKVDDILDELNKKYKYIFVDMHAEATSEKIAMGWYLDGRVSAVVGTHTHVQTHDEQVLPRGTAYVTDVGMVGSREGVLGMERAAVLKRFLTGLPSRFIADEGKWMLHGVCIDLNPQSGRAQNISLVRMYENDVIFD